jgi:uncharacterized membrane protein YfcA
MNPIVLMTLGAVTGALIATTGLGGGSLLTPALLLLGLPAPVLIGTDLAIASITKFGAGWRHHAQGTVDWPTVRWLTFGSLPAGYASSLLHMRMDFLLKLLSAALILTGISILAQYYRRSTTVPVQWLERVPLPLVGALIGTLVGLTSIGSGAMMALALTFVRPALTGARFAGTDIVHGVMLSLMAAVGHAQRSAIDLNVVGWVLAGALPSAWIMAGLAPKLPEQISRPLLGGALTLIGTVLFVR